MRGTLAAQQLHQLLMTWFSQGQQVLLTLASEEYGQQAKNFGLRILSLLEEGWEQLVHHMSIDISLIQLLRRYIGSLFENNGKDEC